MALTNKTRLGKRKLEMQELRKEKQVTTSKKHDKNALITSLIKNMLIGSLSSKISKKNRIKCWMITKLKLMTQRAK